MSAARVRCPICKRPVNDPPTPGPASDAPRTFPFCSERCKLIDLGRWLDGAYQIPVVETDEDEGPIPPEEARS